MKPLHRLVIAVLLFRRLSLATSFLPSTPTMNQSPRSVTAESIENAVDNPKFASPKMTSTSNDNDIASNVNTSSIEYPRSLVFEIAALVGELSTLFLTRVPLDPPLEKLPSNSNDNSTDANNSTDKEEFVIARPTTAIEDDDVARTTGKILLKLLQLCHALDLTLATAIRTKMALNNKKYPASLCRGKAGKYTKYSAVTGITKEEGQSTLDMAVTSDDDNSNNNNPSSYNSRDETETPEGFVAASLEGLTADIGSFATERLWSRYHKPRNLLLALLGELGEVRVWSRISQSASFVRYRSRLSSKRT